MGIEVERKFLVSGDNWRAHAKRSAQMAQGYLNDARALAEGREQCSVRVRIAGEKAFLNLKSRQLGPRRQEFEYQVPLPDGREMLALCVGGVIEKIRHYVDHGDHLWEVDEFLGDNAGLLVAEIELDSVEERFAIPAWAGREVTEHARYYNLALAAHPFKHWTELEKS